MLIIIEGLSPTLAVGQGHNELSPRGTVATYTDIYDFLTCSFIPISENNIAPLPENGSSDIPAKKLSIFFCMSILQAQKFSCLPQ